MRARPILVVGVIALVICHGANVHAQRQKHSLHRGRPHQLLRGKISEAQAALLQQIDRLQAQLDANAANDALQEQLIGALQSMTAQLQSSLSTTQASVDSLTAYNLLQDELLLQGLAKVTALQEKMGEPSADLNALFALYNAQQAVLTALTDQMTFLAAQGNTPQEQLMALGSQLEALRAEYQATSNRLAGGCPPGSSIRQINAATVVCEADRGANIQATEFVGASVTAAPGVVTTADVFCGASAPPYVASGGGVSATAGISLVQSVRLATNGWRVIVQNPNAFNVQVQARVSCVRVN